MARPWVQRMPPGQLMLPWLGQFRRIPDAMTTKALGWNSYLHNLDPELEALPCVLRRRQRIRWMPPVKPRVVPQRSTGSKCSEDFDA